MLEPPVEERLKAAADNAARLALELAKLRDDLWCATRLVTAILVEAGGKLSIPDRVFIELSSTAILHSVNEHDHVVLWLTEPLPLQVTEVRK